MGREDRSQARHRRRRRIRKLRLLAFVGVLGVLCTAAFGLGLVSAIASEIPDLDPERQQARELNGYVYASDGRTILAVLRGEENRVLVDGDEISDWMKHAIVAIEDRRFYDHRGIDLRGIARALWSDIRHKRLVEGGSTITQQFVKNVYVRDERTLARKLREAALAWQLERPGGWTKDKILTEYLNTIYFGNGAYGIQQAAKIYFGHGASKLTLAQAALLAGIPQDPSAYDPVTRPAAARARRATVLRAMLEEAYITPADFRRAVRTPLPRPEDVRQPGVQSHWAPYFANHVTEELVDRLGPGKVYGGGLRIRTTVDLGLQKLAQEAVHGVLSDPEGPQASLVAIDPTTGEVLAMVGGRNYRESQFNLATQSLRQAGSSFKPFVLATALEQGISPATTMESKPVSIPLGDKVWSVANYDDVYLGRVDLATATEQSDNAVYAQLTKLVGPVEVVKVAKRLGVRSPLRGFLSIGLGAQAVNPLELARAYTVFANGGYRIDVEGPTGDLENRARVLEVVADEEGNVVDDVRPVSRRVVSERTAGWVNALLQRVVESGTARRAALEGWPAAGKTGTTENYGDAWFVGYTPQLVVAVWVGYPSKLKPMLTEYHGEPVAGGTFPAEIWKAFMDDALPYLQKEPIDFTPPPSSYEAPKLVVERDGVLRLDNGLCRARMEIVYFGDQGPKRTANCLENEVEVPIVRGLKVDDAVERLRGQPLTPVVVYAPAKPGQKVGVVLDQIPSGGRLSSFDEVKLVLAKAQRGVVPNLLGSTLAEARTRLRRLKVASRVEWGDGPPGTIVAQKPSGGVAAGPGLTVRLVVARGSGTASP